MLLDDGAVADQQQVMQFLDAQKARYHWTPPSSAGSVSVPVQDAEPAIDRPLVLG
jgi:hypothetical protein